MLSLAEVRSKVANIEHPVVMAFGNPLLDVFAVTPDNQLLLDKFKLEIDGQIELDRDEMDQLLDELGCCLCDDDDDVNDHAGDDKSKKITCAGGCALNTVRILQQLLCGGGGGGAVNDRPKSNDTRTCVYYGSLGNDARADTVIKLVKTANIDSRPSLMQGSRARTLATAIGSCVLKLIPSGPPPPPRRFAVHPSLPTGICVSIINDSQRSTCERSLAANLGAAGVYRLSDLNNTVLPLDSVRIIYIEGFFIAHSLDVAKQVVKRAQGKNIIIAFNLCGTYIFEQHSTEICEMVGLAHIIFGNVEEMIALARALNLEYNDDPADIPFILNKLKRVTVNAAAAASTTCSNDWLVSNNIIVMTQGGSNPATVVWGQGSHASSNPVQPTRPIRDTTGAGDALVAGFFAGLITGQDPATCLRWGCTVAAQVITNIGATLLAAEDTDKLDDFLLYFVNKESTK